MSTAYDQWKTSDPSDDSIREAAQENDQDRYVQDWLDGNLVELDGTDMRYETVHRALDEDGINDIAAAMEAMRAGKWPQVTALMAKFLTDIEQEIRKDAAKK